MEMIKMEQVESLKDAYKEASNDDTPYIGIKDDEIHVLGDPNKTEVKPADYEVCFAFPNTEEWRKKAQDNNDEIGKTTEDGRYFLCTRKYKGVYLSPRRAGAAISTLALLESFIFKVTENGEIKDLNREELQSVMFLLNRDLSDATYELVTHVLRIPYDEMEWMLPMNTVENAIKIVMNNRSAVNEADLFFDLPQGK